MTALLDKVKTLVPQWEELTGEDGDLTKLKDVIKTFDALPEGTDLAEVVGQFEQDRDKIAALDEKIGKAQAPLYVPGLDNEVKQRPVSFTKIIACLAQANEEKRSPGAHLDIFEKNHAGYEFAVLKEIAERMPDQHFGPDAKKAQIVSDKYLGGVHLNEQLVPDIIRQFHCKSAILGFEDEDGEGQAVTVLDGLTGGSVRYITEEGDESEAYWIDEKKSYPKDEFGFGDCSLQPHKIGTCVPFSEEFVRMAGPRADASVRRRFRRAFVNRIDKDILYGDYTNAPSGLIHTDGAYVYSAELKQIVGKIGDDLSQITPNSGANAGIAQNWNGGILDVEGIDCMQTHLKRMCSDVEESWGITGAPEFFKKMRHIRTDCCDDPNATQQPYLAGFVPLLTRDFLTDQIGQYTETARIVVDRLPGQSVGGTAGTANQIYSDVFTGNWADFVFAMWSGIEIRDDGGLSDFHRDCINVKARMWCDWKFVRPESFVFCPDACAA